jgi:hypothetical protein
MALSIRAEYLVRQLSDLLLTADATPDSPLGHVLLWTARGEHGDEPGQHTLLVSSDGQAAGQCAEVSDAGTLPATLMPVAAANLIVAHAKGAVREAKRRDTEVFVEMRRVGDHVVASLREDGALFQPGVQVEARVGDLAEYPVRQIAEFLQPEEGDAVPGRAWSPEAMKLAGKIARSRKSPPVVYAAGAASRLVIEVGEGSWRGAVRAPVDAEQLARGGRPVGELHLPHLPSDVPAEAPAGSGGDGPPALMPEPQRGRLPVSRRLTPVLGGLSR